MERDSRGRLREKPDAWRLTWLSGGVGLLALALIALIAFVLPPLNEGGLGTFLAWVYAPVLLLVSHVTGYTYEPPDQRRLDRFKKP
jgi:hypothetical protein